MTLLEYRGKPNKFLMTDAKVNLPLPCNNCRFQSKTARHRL
ncbi:hypothetical protein [Microcoleus sp. PH2017_09_SFU_O_A]|nr:hypothetical protein [Microcoleus sp. PH2017_09_SFU_O_A]